MEPFSYDQAAIDELVQIFKGEVEDNSADWAYEHIANWLTIQKHLSETIDKDQVKSCLQEAYWIEPEDIRQEIFLFSIEKKISLSDVRFRQGFLSMLMVVIRDWITWKEKVFLRLHQEHLLITEEVDFIDEEIIPFLHKNSIFQTLPLFGIEPYLLYLQYTEHSTTEIAAEILTCDTQWLSSEYIAKLKIFLAKLRKKHSIIMETQHEYHENKDTTGPSKRTRLRRGSKRRSS